MRRFIVIFLSVILLLTGCNSNVDKTSQGDTQYQPVNNVPETKTDTDAKTDNDTSSKTETDTDNDNVTETDTESDGIQLVWKNQTDYINEEVEFRPTSYTANVPEYQIASDLSNVDNMNRFNGFTEEQLNKLKNNGFVVLDPNPDKAYYYMKMYDIYEENQYKQIPNFITVDVAIHLYHKFFDETLKRIEKEQLFDALKQLTENILQKSIMLYSMDTNQTVKEELSHNIVYFSVANKLINDSYGDIPNELISIAEAEIEKIESAKGYSKSPLFGFDINYEQFIVRGHYTGDEALEKYFKTMMWYGLIGYPFYDKSGNPDYESITKALIITYTANLELNGIDDITLWDKIYAPTDFFVGQSDDITLFDMKKVITEVYGLDPALEDFKNEAYYEKLIEEIKKLPAPQIQHRLITDAVDTPTGKQFRFMGQRYTLDANIMQELMFPILRPVPTGLDVVGAFDNERAETLVKDSYLMNLSPEKYSQELQLMKDKVKSLKLSDWQQNLYNGWLWVLKSVWAVNENTENLPFFMQNQAWYDKNIQTGLGSYAELKHDTVLYAKQPVAEMGGLEEPEEFYPHYVEPAVEVYDKLLWLVKYSKVNLEKKGLLSKSSEFPLEQLESIYQLFRDCSVKELEYIPLSEEENRALKLIGGTMEIIDDSLSQEYKQSISSAVVSDVAGIADAGMFLEIGTGLPNEIWVAVSSEGKVYLARGVVYSYYEFLSGKPLTDQEWHEMLGIERVEVEEWHYEQINPELLLKNVPPQPEWIRTFKSSEENRVDITPIEYRAGE